MILLSLKIEKRAEEIHKRYSNKKNKFFQFNIKNNLQKSLIYKIDKYDVIIFLMTKKVFRAKYNHFNCKFFNELNDYNISILSQIIDYLIKKQKNTP